MLMETTGVLATNRIYHSSYISCIPGVRARMIQRRCLASIVARQTEDCKLAR